jgi:Tropinone reductase 1
MDFSQRWSLRGRTALVTGGTKGIGRAVAEELLRLGAEVTIVARTERDVDATVEALGAIGAIGAPGRAHGIVADVTTTEGRTRVFERLTGRVDALDVLVNNVGTNVRRAFVDYADDELERVLHVNLVSALHVTRAAHPLLARSGSAAVVSVASVAGLVMVRSGIPYGASKAALVQATRGLAVEWAAQGIRVNAVAPWYTETPLAAPVLGDPALRAAIVGRTPLGRIATPEEVAAPIAFLCLPAASYVTGACLTVDGGFLANGWS